MSEGERPLVASGSGLVELGLQRLEHRRNVARLEILGTADTFATATLSIAAAAAPPPHAATMTTTTTTTSSSVSLLLPTTYSPTDP